MENSEKKFLIDLNFKPTKNFETKLVISLFDYLLHFRAQIPFHFDLFERFIQTKTRTEISEDVSKKPDWKTEKQIKLAVETYEKICLLKVIIEKSFVPGTSLMFLFGSTIHTAKEAYHIVFPPVNKTSLPAPSNEAAAIRRILLKIIEEDWLKPCEKHILPVTNIFILFGASESNSNQPDMNQLKNFKLSKSCKKFIIQFRDMTDFNIFQEEFQGLQLNENIDKEIPPVNWVQAKVFAKGFKDVLVNNKSIWY